MEVFLLGLLLGVQHALDPDHVVAVSTIVSEQRDWRRASMFGLFWGLGHTATLFIAGLLVLGLRLTIPAKVESGFELLVAAMIFFLGVRALQRSFSPSVHSHAHSMRRPFLVGLLHGAAGSAALTLLVLGSISSLLAGLLYILLFGLGSVLGMLFLSGVIGLPFALSASRSARVHQWLQRATGVFGICFGLFFGWEILSSL